MAGTAKAVTVARRSYGLSWNKGNPALRGGAQGAQAASRSVRSINLEVRRGRRAIAFSNSLDVRGVKLRPASGWTVRVELVRVPLPGRPGLHPRGLATHRARDPSMPPAGRSYGAARMSSHAPGHPQTAKPALGSSCIALRLRGSAAPAVGSPRVMLPLSGGKAYLTPCTRNSSRPFTFGRSPGCAYHE